MTPTTADPGTDLSQSQVVCGKCGGIAWRDDSALSPLGPCDVHIRYAPGVAPEPASVSTPTAYQRAVQVREAALRTPAYRQQVIDLSEGRLARSRMAIYAQLATLGVRALRNVDQAAGVAEALALCERLGAEIDRAVLQHLRTMWRLDIPGVTTTAGETGDPR